MKLRSRLLEPVAAWGAVWAFRLLYLTLRREFHFADQACNPYVKPKERTFTYCVWHDSLLAPLFLGRQPATLALVGGHRDGTFLANSLKALGIGSARGSTSSGGTAAVRYLLNEGKDHHLVLTPDGPRGPRREMKTGCSFLSAKTHKAVVPTAFVYENCWSFGTGWTDLKVPKPFTKVYAYTGEPILIPEDASREDLEAYTERIQRAMDELQQVAQDRAEGRQPESVSENSMKRAA